MTLLENDLQSLSLSLIVFQFTAELVRENLFYNTIEKIRQLRSRIKNKRDAGKFPSDNNSVESKEGKNDDEEDDDGGYIDSYGNLNYTKILKE